MDVYLDNNGTTKICETALNQYIKWSKHPCNPSSKSVHGIESKKMIDDSVNYIKKHNNIKNYEVLFTSGATESNCSIINMVVNSWNKFSNHKPHIITSSIEHYSIIKCIKSLVKNNKLSCTFINPKKNCMIDPLDIKKNIKKNTCLISIMYANNEIGSINPMKDIAKIAHSNNIPLHSDITQIYGKYKLNISELGIDTFSMSFHKIYGPVGLGILGISNKLLKGYELEGIITGKQQNSIRSGTEPVPLIAAGIESIINTFNKRDEKNKKLNLLRNEFINILKKHIYYLEYDKLLKIKNENDVKEDLLFSIIGENSDLLPNTILLCLLIKNKDICNVKIRDELNKKGIIISIGSTCNTYNKKASHVLDFLNFSNYIKRGILRISIGDNNSKKDIKKICKELIYILT